MNSNNKVLLIVGLVVIVLLVGGWFLLSGGDDATPTPARRSAERSVDSGAPGAVSRGNPQQQAAEPNRLQGGAEAAEEPTKLAEDRPQTPERRRAARKPGARNTEPEPEDEEAQARKKRPRVGR